MRLCYVWPLVFRMWFAYKPQNTLKICTRPRQALNITLNKEEKELRGKRLYKCCMAKFLPLSDALVEMVTVHLPSPVAAQRYRISSCYKGKSEQQVLFWSI